MKRTRRQNFYLILVLGILNALTPFTIDLYLPAFPQIASDLGVAAARMSLTVSVYFIGYALGQLFYGPLLDRYGRKPPIYAGLAIYLAASLGCMTARSFEALLVFRFVSALGGCAASVGATSMVRDYFPAKEGGKIFSMLMLVLSASPLLAPTIGSFMVGLWGWRMLFAALSALAVLDLALVAWALPHGYDPDPSVSLRPGPILAVFKSVFSERQFRRYVIAGSLSFAGLFIFVAGSPAVFMEGFGLSARQFGGVFALLAGGMIGGGQLNHLLLKRSDSARVFRLALFLQVIASAVFFAGTVSGAFGFVGTLVSLFPILLCAGVSFPNAVSLALAPFTQNIGSASALLGFLQLGLGSLAAAALGALDMSGPLPMASVMAVCTTIALGVVFKRN